MRITDIVTDEPTGWLRLRTDGDHEGRCPGVPSDVARMIQAIYAPMLLGAGPQQRERLWRAMIAESASQGIAQPLWAYVDVALWDLLGNGLGLPVCRVLGGFRNRIPASRRGNSGLGEADAAEAAVAAAAAGCWAYVDPGARPVEATIELAQRLRQAVGPDFRLVHDGGGRYTRPEALRLGRGLEAASYPFARKILESAVALATALRTPCQGQICRASRHFHRHSISRSTRPYPGRMPPGKPPLYWRTVPRTD